LKFISIVNDLQYTISNRRDSYRDETEKVYRKTFLLKERGCIFMAAAKKAAKKAAPKRKVAAKKVVAKKTVKKAAPKRKVAKKARA